MTGPDAVGSTEGQHPPAVPPSLSALLAALGTAAYAVDEQGRIVAVNAHAERLLARPAGELLDHDAHDLLHRNRYGAPLPRTQCGMREAYMARRTMQSDEEWFERGDGSLVPVSWLLTPLQLDSGAETTLVVLHLPQEHDAAGAEANRLHGPLSELERLALLAETTTQLTSTLDVEQALRRLVSLVVPQLADWAIVDLITEHGEVRRTVVVHAENGELVHREDLQGPMPPVLQGSMKPLSRALRGVSSALAGPETYLGAPDSGIAVEQRRLFEETGIHSAAIAPIRGVREVLGALTLGRSQQPDPLTAADLPLLEDITRRAGLALDNARLYQRQRKVAETMQRHLLPQLPQVPGLQMTARYLAAPDASQVGGDWYDAFTLSDGATALAIGDVVGHDLDAAAGMAQIRNMLRAYAWAQQETPSRIVERLDQAVLHITEVTMATLLFARMTFDDGRCRLWWTNAGHPPPLLVTSDGRARYLTEGHGILLGAGSHGPRPDASAELPPAATLLLYTDGLIETPGRSLDEGLHLLRRHAASLAHRPLEAFTDLLLERARPSGNDDDVALLALRIPPES
ncbi:DNA-binding protein [Streptomyces viridosporus ATCC 14672]|uniref:protein-serine/threonine phosphatase n=1 Tax=Streptomyces viridosporus (strain ATCC 14672 / DSM 40746 / JCM 4963 / KCTC 9882 / NRRL B-12104 / FH 1290) TaxID=566461 RepID=D5ZX97_STRV1|nr:SpoIIE family protein phosphatase [Streptomyces viridosporus]EFE65207.1 DNA-binding protein [Streptomyces viridosporus ATCC 14672]